MAQYHEPLETLSTSDLNYVRALESLKEEIEAIGWYHQRMAATDDTELHQILEHNRNEEIEHAAMIVEWLRIHMPGWDEQLKEYLFKKT
jgi:uncharacterized protein